MQELVPTSQLLKLMMDRVEAASLSMQLGTPVSLLPKYAFAVRHIQGAQPWQRLPMKGQINPVCSL